MSPSFDAEDASVVKVDVRDPQSAARVGKFMVVVPRRCARARAPRAAREESNDASSWHPGRLFDPPSLPP